MTETLDAARADAFAERMLGALNDAALILLTSLGQRTALFDTMAELPPSTSAHIADQAGLQERYLRQWLGGIVAGGVVEYDPGERTYRLPADHAAALTRASGPHNMGAIAAYVPVLASVEDEVAECFHTGGGVPYSSYPRLQEVMAEDTGAVFDATLIDTTLPLSPGLVDRLGRPFWTMGELSPGFSVAAPYDLPGCAASADPSMSFAHQFSCLLNRQ